MVKRIKDVPEGGNLYKNYSDSWKKSPWNEPSCTIKENHGGVNLHPKKARALTPREIARIQTFPDWWAFCGSVRHPIRQVGNAVPPLLAAAIGSAIRSQIFGLGEASLEQSSKVLDQRHLFD